MIAVRELLKRHTQMVINLAYIASVAVQQANLVPLIPNVNPVAASTPKIMTGTINIWETAALSAVNVISPASVKIPIEYPRAMLMMAPACPPGRCYTVQASEVDPEPDGCVPFCSTD